MRSAVHINWQDDASASIFTTTYTKPSCTRRFDGASADHACMFADAMPSAAAQQFLQMCADGIAQAPDAAAGGAAAAADAESVALNAFQFDMHEPPADGADADVDALAEAIVAPRSHGG